MLTALALIAACEIIRMALSTIQILLLVNDASSRDDAYKAFIKSLDKNDKEIIREFLQEADEYFKKEEEGEQKCQELSE